MNQLATLRYKRLFLWALAYAVIMAIVGGVVLRQAHKVNTLDFAPGKLTLATTKQKYTVGDTVGYTITNQLNTPITLLDLCPQEPLHVYSWKDNAWQRVHASAADAQKCAANKQQTIAPGASISGDYANWATLFSSPGIYRIVLLASNYNGLAYADFQVAAKPAAAAATPAPQVIYQQVYTPVYTPVYIPVQGGTNGGGRGDD